MVFNCRKLGNTRRSCIDRHHYGFRSDNIYSDVLRCIRKIARVFFDAVNARNESSVLNQISAWGWVRSGTRSRTRYKSFVRVLSPKSAVFFVDVNCFVFFHSADRHTFRVRKHLFGTYRCHGDTGHILSVR